MSEEDLQEAFRQLALDLDAVTEDDPDLRDFTIRRDGKEVHVQFRAYKALLELRVSDRARKKRPQATVHRSNAIDRLGRSIGVDEKLDLDEAFLERFDVVTEAPRESIEELFRSRASRDACVALDELGALPVWINSESVGMSENAGVKDLSKERIEKIVEALALLENTLGEWDEKPDRRPIVKDGRRMIKKTPRPSWLGKFLDWTPLAMIFVTIFMAIVWSMLPGWAIGKHWSVLIALAGVISIVTFFGSVRALRGQKGALLRAVGRTAGASVIGSHLMFFGLHVYNRGAGPSHIETARVVEYMPPRGKSSGAIDYVREGDPDVHRIGSGWNKPEGQWIRITVHEGRLGWLWCEYDGH